MSSIKVATVFSGIGAIEHALKRMEVEHEIVFACDNGNIDIFKDKNEAEKEAIEQAIKKIHDPKEKKQFVDQLYADTGKVNFVKESYFANYDVQEENFYNDIKFLDGTHYKDEVDLFVGGSPCQSFSIAGKRGGFEDTRGTLFYDFARLVKEIQPKVFIYENVKGLLNHDKGKTWTVVQNVFNDLGYTMYTKLLNSKDYGIPQSRNRVFVVGFKDEVDFQFPEKVELTKTLQDFLEPEVDAKYYLKEKGILSVTKEFTIKKKYTQINGTVSLCQNANQQYNWKGDFIYEGEGGLESITTNSKVRKLTPQECLHLMGFHQFKQVVSDMQMYKQSGNSIVVDVLMNILFEIKKTNYI